MNIELAKDNLTIDLENLNPWFYKGFRLIDAIVEDEKGTYDLNFFDSEKDIKGCGISLIIGKNGVGKSYLFRALIEFFVDFQWFVQDIPKRPYSNSRYKISRLRYLLGGNEYEIVRDGNKFSSKINLWSASPTDVMIPNIVAAHFGLYDRFPIKRDRYDVDCYNYVGTKAGGNFISTNNIITQMLYSLCEDREERVIKRIIKAFSKVGYDPKVTIRVRLNASARLKDSDLSKVTSFEKFRNILGQEAEINPNFKSYAIRKIENFTVPKKKNLYKTYKRLRKDSEIVLDLRDYDSFTENREHFSNIYLLKQLQLISKLNISFYRNGIKRDCNTLSSGEINMLATVVSVASSIIDYPALILLDEPELNQHPNWQMSIVNHLNEIFGDFTCHLFIASHSHFLVSDLPGEKSVVIQLDYSDKGLSGKMISANTYGWSAEQVLLEVFETATDRNLYLGNMVGTLLDKIKNRHLEMSEVTEQLEFLNRVSENLKDFDPLKKIISSLNKAFNPER